MEANAVFANEFGDLQTPVLRTAVLDMVQQVAADPIMRGRPLAEITREAGLRVRADVYRSGAPQTPGLNPADPLPAATPAPAADPMARRMELKERTVVTPLHETGARYQPPAAEDAAYPSNAEYVQLLRKGRNQPPTG